MGLRLGEGIDPARYEALSGRRLDGGRLRTLIDGGYVERDPSGRLRVTSAGAPLLDSVVAGVAA